MNDTLLFLRAWLKDPSRVGAVAPSGRALAKLITAHLTPSDQTIIELGPGTGAFTAALIARGIKEHRLALVEADPAFARALKLRFPTARVLAMDATHLGDVASLFEQPADAIISGLPLLAMQKDAVSAILGGAFGHLRAGGSMYQFTYVPRCPVGSPMLEQLRLEGHRVGSAWANLPPAFVYRLRRLSTAAVTV